MLLPKSVLFVANYTQSIGGISGQIEMLTGRLSANNFNVELFNTKGSIARRLLIPALLYLRGRRYAIFHIHGCSFLGFYPIIVGVLIGKVLKKRLIVTYHGGGLEEFLMKHRQLVKFFVRKADLLTVPSKYLESIFRVNGIASVVLPNIMREDNVLFKQRKAIRPNLIVTRSLEPVYNIPLAIEAYSRLKKKYPGASLRIVGDGSEHAALELLVGKLKLRDVHFVGRVTNDEIGSELNKADIFINPSNKDSFSVSMFEAFACGLPVVSTKVGAISDFVTDGYNGLLVNNNDCEKMVKKIELLLENQNLASVIAENAYKTYLQYRWEELKNTYCNIYADFEK